MCTSSPTSLLFVDRSENPCCVRLLNCTSKPPKCHTLIICTRDRDSLDICHIQHGDRNVLLNVYSKKGITAYDMQTNTPKWMVKGKLGGMTSDLDAWGITTDGYGHLFICDWANSSVQMFTVDGVYLGPVLKEGEQGLGTQGRIHWCKSLSSFVVAHKKKECWEISLVEVL